MVFGDRFIMKFFRRLEPGVNPDLEISRFLTDKGFAAYAAGGRRPGIPRKQRRTDDTGSHSNFIPLQPRMRGNSRLTLWAGITSGSWRARAPVSRPAAEGADPGPDCRRTAALGSGDDWNLPGIRPADRREPPSFMWPWHPGVKILILPPTFHCPLSAFHLPVDAHDGRPGARATEAAAFHATRRTAGGSATSVQPQGRGSPALSDLLERKIRLADSLPRGLPLGQLLYTGKDFVIIDLREIRPARSVSGA